MEFKQNNPAEGDSQERKRSPLEQRIQKEIEMGETLKAMEVNGKPVITDCIPSQFYFDGIDDFAQADPRQMEANFKKLLDGGLPFLTIPALISLISFATGPILIDDIDDIVIDPDTKAKTLDNSHRKLINDVLSQDTEHYPLYLFYKRNKLRMNMLATAMGHLRSLAKSGELSDTTKQRFEEIDAPMQSYIFDMNRDQKQNIAEAVSRLAEDVVLEVISKYKK